MNSPRNSNSSSIASTVVGIGDWRVCPLVKIRRSTEVSLLFQFSLTLGVRTTGTIGKLDFGIGSGPASACVADSDGGRGAPGSELNEPCWH
jgi:hypothetical protein